MSGECCIILTTTIFVVVTRCKTVVFIFHVFFGCYIGDIMIPRRRWYCRHLFGTMIVIFWRILKPCCSVPKLFLCWIQSFVPRCRSRYTTVKKIFLEKVAIFYYRSLAFLYISQLFYKSLGSNPFLFCRIRKETRLTTVTFWTRVAF